MFSAAMQTCGNLPRTWRDSGDANGSVFPVGGGGGGGGGGDGGRHWEGLG